MNLQQLKATNPNRLVTMKAGDILQLIEAKEASGASDSRKAKKARTSEGKPKQTARSRYRDSGSLP